jgi:hypothetical protein
MAPPGRYQVRATVDGRVVGAQSFRLLPDPRVAGVTAADYAAQFRFLQRVSDRFSAANEAVKTIRYVRSQVDDRRTKLSGDAGTDFDRHSAILLRDLASVEDSIYQTRSRSGQDPLNYPIRLNNKIGALLGVVGGSAGRPTAQAVEVFERLNTQLDRELARMRAAIDAHLPAMNAALKAAGQMEVVPRAVDSPAGVPALP